MSTTDADRREFAKVATRLMRHADFRNSLSVRDGHTGEVPIVLAVGPDRFGWVLDCVSKAPGGQANVFVKLAQRMAIISITHPTVEELTKAQCDGDVCPISADSEISMLISFMTDFHKRSITCSLVAPSAQVELVDSGDDVSVGAA